MNYFIKIRPKLASYTIIMILCFGAIISIDPQASAQTDRTPCRPLHVDGKYLKTDQGTIIQLHGCEGGGAFTDGGNGNWMTDWGFKFSEAGWNTTYVKNQLDNMVKWGANALRIQLSVELWMNNVDNIRSHLAYVITEASNRGIYCIISPYQVRYWGQPGSEQDPLPYPPYCNSYSAQIIPNASAYVKWHSQLTSYYRNYPGVIWEVWNEPHSDNAFNEYMTVVQQCITNARNNGARQVFFLAWGAGGLDTNWVNTALKIRDPANIGYGLMWHCYNAYNHLGVPRPTSYSQVATAMSGIVSLSKTRPCFIGEFGAEYTVPSDVNVVDWQMTVMDNAGISYVMHWLRPDGAFMYVNDNFSPTAAGQVLINHMQPYDGRSHYLTISNGAGGSISPSRGVYRYNTGALARVTARANSGYVFDHWVLDGLNYSADNPVYVPMCRNHTLQPVFVTRLSWSTSFETGNFNQCTGVLHQGTYSANVTTTNPKTGKYHADFVSSSQNGYSCGYKTFTDRSRVRMTFQIRFVEGYADTNGSWLSYGALANSANGESESVIIQNVGGKLYWGINVNGVIYLASSSSTINTNRYYKVELVRNINGLQQLYIDNALKVQQTINLFYGANIATFGVDFNTGKAVRVYIDDVSVFN
jgi:hypothetical protein